MRLVYRTCRKDGRYQRGVAAVEFAFLAIPFFLILFGIVEAGRLMYVLNTVQEVTRNAARLAVVTDFTDQTALEMIRRQAVFRLTEGTLPAAPEIASGNIVIRFLNAEGELASPLPINPVDNLSACRDAIRVGECIRYVEVCVSKGSGCSDAERVAFVPVTGLFSGASENSVDWTFLKIPLSSTRMPAESLGFRLNY
jgi:hypothetical protein